MSPITTNKTKTHAPSTQSSPPPKRKRNTDHSLFARFQLVLLVATLTLWYMILIADHHNITTSTQHHPSFFNSQQHSDSDCSTSKVGSSSSSSTRGLIQKKQQLLQHIHSTSELTQPYHLLTIAIDTRHSCPDLCVFVHPLLPSWVRYRQLHFDTEVDLAEKLRDENGHVIVVARTNIINIANWAVERRTNYSSSLKNNNDTSTLTKRSSGIPSTGLFHNADERFHKGEIVNVYDKFDYVLRQYYRRDEVDGKFHGYTLHALGNYTCGTTTQDLPILDSTTVEPGPKWGVHYVPLNAHTVDVQLLHHATSNYPTSLRPNNCSFIGRSDVKRSLHERSIMETAVQEHGGADMNCTVIFTGGFASGNTKFEYFNYDISQSKIGLSPRGSALETHRLAELLRMGAVPAIVSEDYLFATFKPVPGIIAEDWPAVVKLMKEYLAEERRILAESGSDDEATGGSNNKISKLEMLSREGTKWYADLEACMMEDMSFILKGAFGLSNR